MKGAFKTFSILVAAGAALVSGSITQSASADGYEKGKSSYTPAISGSNWSGLYFGANAGWVGKDYDWAFNPPFGTFNQKFSLGQDQGIYGGHIGIQHQWGQWVLGVEAALSGSDHDWASHRGYGTGASFAEVRTGSLFTVGPRLGWAPNNQWLLFGTGGYATASVLTRGRAFSNGSIFQETSEKQDGYYLGGGVEYAVTPNIILGVEYQHVFLGDAHHCVDTCVPTSVNNHDVSADMDIVRARVSFKIGRNEPAYEPMK